MLADEDGSPGSVEDSDAHAGSKKPSYPNHDSSCQTNRQTDDKPGPRLSNVSRFVVEHNSRTTSGSTDSENGKINAVSWPVTKPSDECVRETSTHNNGNRDTPSTNNNASSSVRNLNLESGSSTNVDANRKAQTGNRVLTLLLPGVTIPAFHVIYLAITVLIAAAVHELGHALAAAAYDAQVARVGGFFALVFLGAFLQLEGVEKLIPFAQLEVLCTGAWHNFVSAVAALAMFAALPSFLKCT